MRSSRRRLLVVSTVAVWPVDNGFSLRAAALLPELAKQWSVMLIAPPGGTGEVAPYDWELDACESLELDARWSYFQGQYDTSGVVSTVRGLAQRWNPSVALLLSGAEYVAFDDPTFPPTVADRVDCLSLIRWRALPRLYGLRRKASQLHELAQVAAYERRVTRRMGVTLLAGESDARFMRWLGTGRGDVRVLTNGVHAQVDAGWHSAATAPVVIFTGVLGYPPNVDAAIHLARDIWPAVRRKVPEARLHLVGRQPDPSVLDLARDPSIRVLADVPDMTRELRRAWLAVAPMLSGSGVKNKVLEAWATGRPVVMTPLAANGLEPTPQLAELVARTPDRLADLIVELLSNPARRVALGNASLELAQQRFAWSGVACRLSEILASLSR